VFAPIEKATDPDLAAFVKDPKRKEERAQRGRKVVSAHFWEPTATLAAKELVFISTKRERKKMSLHLDTSSLETRCFIGGKFVETSKKFPTVNPVTEEIICEVFEAGQDEVNLAVEAARKAFDRKSKWRTMDASGRRDLLLKLGDLIERDEQILGDLDALDNGKPRAANFQAYGSSVDVMLAKQCIRYFAGWADKLSGQTNEVDGNLVNLTFHEPIGVCGMIIPWNFPLLMAIWKLGPALACGCTVVLKSSEKTPLSALHLAKLINEAGFPPGVVNILSGFGPTCGQFIAEHMDVNKVAFTGSTKVGKIIAELAAKSNLKDVTLELGGKSPLIITKDAGKHLDEAVAVAHAAMFTNQGQVCCAGSRVYVDAEIHDEFVKKTVEYAKNLKLGDQFDTSTTQGPLVDQIQFQRVVGYLEKAKQEGAKLEFGGGRHGEKGYFIQPTVYSGVTDDMTIAREEIFGPVMSVMTFKTLNEVIDRANDTNYGLAAGVFCKDIAVALHLARNINAGTVWINTYNQLPCNVPFGGFKESGMGRELGSYGLRQYLAVKSVTINLDHQQT